MARAVLEDTEGSPPPLSHCPTILMFIKMDNSIEGVLTKIANIKGTRERSSKQSKRLQKSRIKATEHSLLGCESLGSYSRTVAGIKLKISIVAMATWMV